MEITKLVDVNDLKEKETVSDSHNSLCFCNGIMSMPDISINNSDQFSANSKGETALRDSGTPGRTPVLRTYSGTPGTRSGSGVPHSYCIDGGIIEISEFL